MFEVLTNDCILKAYKFNVSAILKKKRAKRENDDNTELPGSYLFYLNNFVSVQDNF